jgi:hypothetical protein
MPLPTRPRFVLAVKFEVINKKARLTKPKAFHFCTRNTPNAMEHTDYQLLEFLPESDLLTIRQLRNIRGICSTLLKDS